MTLAIVIGVLFVIGFLFMTLSPEFGGKATKEQMEVYAKSENHQNGKFINLDHVKIEMSGENMMKAIGGMFRSIPNATPSPIDVNRMDSLEIADYEGRSRVFWFGHSAFLVQMNGKNLLIDPMFGNVPAPHPLLGGKRFSKGLPIEIEKLPRIDAVLISHDHYDHLDYGSIKKLKHKVGTFYTPLGLGVHLEEWGVSRANIVELDWWQEAQFQGFTFVSTPAQHFSGRGLSDRDKTQWCSWVIQSEGEKVFFSGDSGYASHFKDIGHKYGPFDFAMMECGQYNKLWPDVHMFPEETAQAALDVQARITMPIHWGAFKLAQHSWTDPIERVLAKAKDLDVLIAYPEIGQPTYFNGDTAYHPWWTKY